MNSLYQIFSFIFLVSICVGADSNNNKIHNARGRGGGGGRPPNRPVRPLPPKPVRLRLLRDSGQQRLFRTHPGEAAPPADPPPPCNNPHREKNNGRTLKNAEKAHKKDKHPKL